MAKRKFYAMEWYYAPHDRLYTSMKRWHYLGVSVAFPDKFSRDAYVAMARSFGRKVEPCNATAAEKAENRLTYNEACEMGLA